MKPTITVIHPSRSRPELAKKTYDMWMGNAANTESIEYILSLDVDDPELDKYGELFSSVENELTTCWIGLHQSAIDAINAACKKCSTGNIMIVVSDDFDCPPNWDVELLKQLEGQKDFAAKAQDGIQPWMMTMPIMDRTYYERYGYIYNPEYKHMYCDVELSCVAQMTGKYIYLDMRFRHRHYSRPGGIKADEVTKKNDSTYEQGEAVFIERAKRYFDIPDSELIGDLHPDANCAKWFKSKGLF